MTRPSALQKASAAWPDIPAWVEALAKACDASSLRKTAAHLRVSPALISLALNNRHHADLAYIQARAEAHLLVEIVQCPVMNMISKSECLTYQQQPFAPHNPQRVQLFRACRNGCKHNQQPKNQGAVDDQGQTV